ncbi:hypothetical protein HBI56_153800 [Parastagonospora nodorum]|nr:hypothetical protein HBI10_125790 [Parastagonospora nodorum]KAH4024159.1 hypothetical protein HBI13_083730 [Parastagonospora nodorum]KAH4033885.1 hypothetical protein HBI09_114060 [Parastagonospora nodorum]KAH4938188.1 hypothetical protein HBH73_167470 [Parastagonospora nodorum]KAH4943856.1 hypothetical protein HBH74_058220 [Parastagonospora nodorum]
MNPPLSPIELDGPIPTSSRKRTASAISPPLVPPSSDDTTPRILSRRRHRVNNAAASVWGPDIPVTLKPAADDVTNAPPAPASTIPPAPFNIYRSLLRHPNLFFQFALRLPLDSAINLYAIDKEFHYLFNKYSVSILHDYARYWAPISSHVFTWILFPHLCISDPMLRPMNDRVWLARDVPSWRWVGMVLHRQTIVRGILSSLTLSGCGALPSPTESMLCKFWLLVEFKHTHQRQSFLQDTDIWSDADILLFHLFLVKLDMRLTHPILGNAPCGLSHLMLNQPSLTTLHDLLTGKVGDVRYPDLVPLMLRTYPMDTFDLLAFPYLDDEEITGVDEEDWNILGKEGWSEFGGAMELALDCVVNEGLRRELHAEQLLLEFVVFGHGDRLSRKWRKGGREYEGGFGRGRKNVIREVEERFGLVEKKEVKENEEGDAEEMDLSM